MPDAPKTSADFFAGLTPVKPAAGSADPFAGLQEVSPSESSTGSDPFAGLTPVKAKGTYSVDEFNAAKDEDLTNDLDFSPKEFGAENKVALQKDPKALEKAIRIYEAKDKRGTTVGEKAKAVVTGAPKVGKALFDAFKAVSDKAEEFSPMLSPVGAVKTIARIAGGGLEPEVRRKEGKAAEIANAVELGALGSADLASRAGRAVSDKVTGNTDYRQRFFDDVSKTEMTRNAAQANGEVAKALGVDAPTLKERGIEVDEDAVQKLSIAADPVNYIPVAGGVGFIGKLAGKSGKFLLARTLNAEQAAKLAETLNAARKSVSSGVNLAGSALETAGSAVAKGGEALEDIAKSAGGSTAGAIAGGLVSHSVPGAAAGVAAVKGIPKIVQMAGKGAESLGQLVKGTRPASAVESVIGNTVAGAAKGAGGAAAVTFPLLLGADAKEQESLLGGIGLAGAMGGAAGGARSAGHIAQNKLTEHIYKRVERAETPESPYYGTDGALDAAHAAEVANLPHGEQTVLNHFRNFLKDSGVEIYALDQDSFTGRVPKAEGAAQAKGFFTEAGEKISPDGTGQPLIRIFLNGGTDAIGHEMFHALESLDPKGASALREAVVASWTPEQKAQFAEQYNTALNGGKPKELWTHTLSDKDIASDVGAEVFSRVLNSTDLSGVDAPIQQRAATFLSNVLDKLGVKSEGTGLSASEPGVSSIGGVRTSAKNFSDIQSYIKDLSARVNEHGTVFEGTKPNRLAGAKEITTESINPAHPLGVGPKRSVKIEPEVAGVKPKVAPKAKVEVEKISPASKPAMIPEESTTKTEARNIRASRQSQDDFAARRAEVTNIAKATESAKSLKPDVQSRVAEVNKSLESGKPVEIEHSGVKSESTEASPFGRSARRAEQEAAYIQEGLNAAPASIREAHQKVFVPVRWEIVGGKPQLLAMSLDKLIANVHRSVSDATKAKVEKLIPYETQKGKLTDAAWKSVVEDLQSYSDNQAHGYRGDGQRLVRPDTDIGASIPSEDKAYSPVRLDEGKANFLNLVQGIAPPLTAREVKGTGVPGNVKGQIIAEVNKRKPEAPATIKPEHINKQTFKKSGRTVQETNPLRNELSAAGVPVRELIEVTERINADDIKSVRDRSDINFSAPNTDTIRAGFLPSGETVQTFSKKISDSSPEQFRDMVKSWEGSSLTKQAYSTGLGLKTPEDLAVLRRGMNEQTTKGTELREAGKTDEAFDAAIKNQFFREAVEAATDTGSAAGKYGWRRAFPDATPPFKDAPVRSGFLPATAKGKELAKSGFDFVDSTIGNGNRVLYLHKGGKEIGFVGAKEISPGVAEIKMIEIDPEHRAAGVGLGEGLYREMLSRLKNDGITEIIGTIVAPEPLALRKKIFGGFDKLELNLEPVNYEEALAAAKKIKEGDIELLNIDAVNRIDPDQTF